jgi:hypothetical protein
MIAAQPNRPVQERLIAGLMRAPNAVVSQVLIWFGSTVLIPFFT